MEFNTEKHYLGIICIRGHEWDDSGKSLRYKSNRKCIECNKILNPIHRKNYYSKNKEKVKLSDKIYYAKNKEARKKYRHVYYHQNKEKMNAYDKTYHLELRQAYVIHLLKMQFNCPREKISQELIEEKRNLVLIKRKIQEIKKWDHVNEI